MLSLDLFNTVYERALNEGAVDDLEARHIHGLNTKMLDLMNRAKDANPEMKAALKREYAKIKDERDSYYKIREGEVTRTATGLKHRSTDAYGGTPKDKDPLATLDKPGTNRAEKALGIKFDREKKYQGGLDIDETGIPGNVPAEKIPGKEDLLKGRGRSYYEADQKKNSEQVDEDSSSKPLDQKLQRLKTQARRQFPRAHSDDEALILKLLDKETQDNEQNRRVDARQDAELRKNFAFDRDQENEIQDLQTQVGVKEHGGGIGPKQHWQDLMQERKLNVGDPVIVTAPNEFEGKTGEISEFSPSGKFVVVNLYNHGEHSMHLSDVEFNQYAADQDQDDWYDDDKLNEFAPSPDRDDDEVPDQILKLANRWWNATDDQPKIANVLRSLGWSIAQVESEDDAVQLQHNDGTVVFISADDFDPDMFEGWSDAVVAQRTGRPRTPYSVFIKGKKWKDFENDDHAEAVANKLRAKFKAEGRDPSVITIAPTDYDKDLEEEKVRLDPKCWSGKKIGTPKTKMKGGVRVNNCVPAESINEEQDTSGVESAIIRRIMTAHTDLLMKFGPEKVMQAAEEVAYNVGDVDEVGSSDVSAWVHEVKQILGAV